MASALAEYIFNKLVGAIGPIATFPFEAKVTALFIPPGENLISPVVFPPNVNELLLSD